VTWFLAESSSFSWHHLPGLGDNHLVTLLSKTILQSSYVSVISLVDFRREENWVLQSVHRAKNGLEWLPVRYHAQRAGERRLLDLTVSTEAFPLPPHVHLQRHSTASFASMGLWWCITQVG